MHKNIQFEIIFKKMFENMCNFLTFSFCYDSHFVVKSKSKKDIINIMHSKSFYFILLSNKTKEFALWFTIQVL